MIIPWVNQRRGTALLPFTKFAAALTAVKNNTADAFVVDYGDSTRAGVAYGTPDGAPVDPFTNGARDFTISAAFAARLATRGIAVIQAPFTGFNLRSSTDTLANYNAYNPHMVVGTTLWTIGATATMGGNCIRKASATADPVTVNISESINQIDLYVAGNTGAYKVTFDGGTPVTRAVAGVGVIERLQFPCPTGEGVHSIQIDTTSSAVANILMIVPRSTTKRVIVINGGWRGIGIAGLTSTASTYTGINMLQALPAHLGIISVGINDISSLSTTPATFNTQIRVLRDTIALNGNCLLSLPHQINPASNLGPGGLFEDPWRQIYYNMVNEGYLLRDAWTLFNGTYTTLNALGAYNDNVHLKMRSFAVSTGQDLADTAYNLAVAAGYVP